MDPAASPQIWAKLADYGVVVGMLALVVWTLWKLINKYEAKREAREAVAEAREAEARRDCREENADLRQRLDAHDAEIKAERAAREKAHLEVIAVNSETMAMNAEALKNLTGQDSSGKHRVIRNPEG